MLNFDQVGKGGHPDPTHPQNAYMCVCVCVYNNLLEECNKYVCFQNA